VYDQASLRAARVEDLPGQLLGRNDTETHCGEQRKAGDAKACPKINSLSSMGRHLAISHVNKQACLGIRIMGKDIASGGRGKVP
jgi:hypothetical protein